MYRVTGDPTLHLFICVCSEQTYMYKVLFRIKMQNEHILECVELFQTAYMLVFNIYA